MFGHLLFFFSGIDKFVVEDTEEARTNKSLYPRPLNVIEGSQFITIQFTALFNKYDFFIELFNLIWDFSAKVTSNLIRLKFQGYRHN